MSLWRKSVKRDANEIEIVAALRAGGVMVERLSGEGIPDLLCACRGRWYLAECKTPAGTASRAQRAFSERALQRGVTVITLRSVEDALAWLGRLREW